jgi:hypothetical protein
VGVAEPLADLLTAVADYDHVLGDVRVQRLEDVRQQRPAGDVDQRLRPVVGERAEPAAAARCGNDTLHASTSRSRRKSVALLPPM